MQVLYGHRRRIHPASLHYFNMTRKASFMRHGKLHLNGTHTAQENHR